MQDKAYESPHCDKVDPDATFPGGGWWCLAGPQMVLTVNKLFFTCGSEAFEPLGDSLTGLFVNEMKS